MATKAKLKPLRDNKGSLKKSLEGLNELTAKGRGNTPVRSWEQILDHKDAISRLLRDIEKIELNSNTPDNELDVLNQKIEKELRTLNESNILPNVGKTMPGSQASTESTQEEKRPIRPLGHAVTSLAKKPKTSSEDLLKAADNLRKSFNNMGDSLASRSNDPAPDINNTLNKLRIDIDKMAKELEEYTKKTIPRDTNTPDPWELKMMEEIQKLTDSLPSEAGLTAVLVAVQAPKNVTSSVTDKVDPQRGQLVSGTPASPADSNIVGDLNAAVNRLNVALADLRKAVTPKVPPNFDLKSTITIEEVVTPLNPPANPPGTTAPQNQTGLSEQQIIQLRLLQGELHKDPLNPENILKLIDEGSILTTTLTLPALKLAIQELRGATALSLNSGQPLSHTNEAVEKTIAAIDKILPIEAKVAVAGEIKSKAQTVIPTKTAAVQVQNAKLVPPPQDKPDDSVKKGLDDAVARLKKATAALITDINKIKPQAQQAVIVEAQKPLKVEIETIKLPEPQRAERIAQVTFVEPPTPIQVEFIKPQQAIEIKLPERQNASIIRAPKLQQAVIVDPPKPQKATISTVIDPLTDLRRELNKSEPDAGRIKAALAGLAPLNNTNPHLMGTDQELMNSLTRLDNAITTVNPPAAPAVTEKFNSAVSDTRIYLEQHLMLPIRNAVASWVNPIHEVDMNNLKLLIDGALNYSTGLPLYSDLRKPLEELQQKITREPLSDEDKNNFAKTIETHMVERLRIVLAQPDTQRDEQLEAVIKQLMSEPSGLRKNHPLRESALPLLLTQLSALKNAQEALSTTQTALESNKSEANTKAAQDAGALVEQAKNKFKNRIKFVRRVVTEPESLDREAAFAKRLREIEMSASDRQNIIDKVGRNLDRYTNVALYSQQAKATRRSKSRDDRLPATTQKLEDIKLHLEVYRRSLATQRQQRNFRQPVTDHNHVNLMRLRERLQQQPIDTIAKARDIVTQLDILLGNTEQGIDKNHAIYKTLNNLKQTINNAIQNNAFPQPPPPNNAEPYQKAVSEMNNTLSLINNLQKEHLISKFKETLTRISAEPFRLTPAKAREIENDFCKPLLDHLGAKALEDPRVAPLVALRVHLKQIPPVAPDHALITAAMNILPTQRQDDFVKQQQQWKSDLQSLEEQYNKVSQSITAIDDTLEKGDRSYVKPLKLKNYSDECKVVGKDEVQDIIAEFKQNSTGTLTHEGEGLGKSRAFSNNEALVSKTQITTGFGPTKASSNVVSVISNENGRHTSKLHFHENQLKSSLFGGKDGYTKWAAIEIQNFLATSPTPHKPIVIAGNLPKDLVKEMMIYCQLKGIEYINHTPHHHTVSKGDIKSQEERLAKLFKDEPAIAVSANKEATAEKEMSTGIHLRK